VLPAGPAWLRAGPEESLDAVLAGSTIRLRSAPAVLVYVLGCACARKRKTVTTRANRRQFLYHAPNRLEANQPV
jgi:hypothetical protein